MFLAHSASACNSNNKVPTSELARLLISCRTYRKGEAHLKSRSACSLATPHLGYTVPGKEGFEQQAQRTHRQMWYCSGLAHLSDISANWGSLLQKTFSASLP